MRRADKITLGTVLFGKVEFIAYQVLRLHFEGLTSEVGQMLFFLL